MDILKEFELALNNPDAISDEVAVKYWAKNGESTYKELVDRVVNYVCSAWNADRREKMRKLMMERKFLPNTPCWMNAGTDLKSLAACFVLPLEDSMESIFSTVHDTAMVLKEGGGVGLSFSKLRPDGSAVKKTKGVSSGPISFLKVFDAVVDTVKQGGARRGAAMANLRVDHPDILKFIKCKQKEGDISNFNISVALTDEFMDCLENDKEFFLRHNNTVHETINPNVIFDEIALNAWKNGEPGVQFIDTVNRSGTIGYCGKEEYREYNTGLEVSNPCGETFLLPNESCILGAISVYRFVTPWWRNTAAAYGTINMEELILAVELATDFLNSVIDLSEAPIPAINTQTRASRKIGLGVMGLADFLSAMGYPYESEAGRAEAGSLMKSITDIAVARSVRMGYKNATLTLVAPTGTTGVVGGVSGGIEPHFRLLYDRKSVKLGNLKMMSASLADYIKSTGPGNPYVSIILDELAANNGKLTTYGNLWQTADQISVDGHLRMLATVQANVHNSVSKTINLPNSATVEDVKNVFRRAHRYGIKGLTVYRDGSRDEQVLNEISLAAKPEAISGKPAEPPVIHSYTVLKKTRPSKTTGFTEKVRIGCGNLYVTVNSDADGPCEVFTNLGRSGGCPSQSEATSRLISLSLRSGVNVAEIVDQLKGIRCLSTIAGKDKGKQADGTRVLSCPDAIGKQLELSYKDSMKSPTKEKYIEPSMKAGPITTFIAACPECGRNLALQEGCRMCTVCGYSKCG